MARGLSDLQTTILVLALKKSEQAIPSVIGRWEILAAHYGWPTKPLSGKQRTPRFNRLAVGVAEYKAAQVSVTRAVTRLRRRGLIEPLARGRTIILTDAGAALAGRLKASIG